MAEAVLGSVLDQLASIFRVQVEQDVKLVYGMDEDVQYLTESFNNVRAVLADAEMKQVTSEAVKLWLQDLKHIMYDAEDVLDEWCTRIAISQSQSSGVAPVSSFLSSLSSWFQPIILRYQIGHRIIDINERLDKNVNSVSQLNLIANLTKEDLHQHRDFTSSIPNVPEIEGRDSDKQVIIGKLFSETSNSAQGTIIVSIVGMGGLGKTTLAQFIYKEEEVKKKFEIKMWVCVSELFDRVRLAKEIIHQATGQTPIVSGWETLHQDLSKAVAGKQFLLVLDDVWSEDSNDWAPLKSSLNGGAQGSRIVVTTRSKKVAKIMDSIYTHELKQLSDEDCWSLFQRIAFRRKSQDEVKNLEEIGRELAKKCKGVPLAVETLASQMLFENSKSDWSNVLKSDLWDVKTSKDAKRFFPALLLSYHALSPQLKQCFLYTAIFPEDAEIEKDILVKLWMAQGYLGLDGTEELENIGRRCFDDMAMRSFFQKDMRRSNRDLWKMHDLVREFAQYLAKTEFSSEKNGFSSNKVRHVPVNALSENSNICKGSKLRTLIVSHSFSISSTQKLLELFQQLKCLRALELRNNDIEEVPVEVGTLSHLRYLDFSENNKLEELPETVCNLYNLQTLRLNWCSRLRKLPEGVGRLSNLRHLEIEETSELGCSPKSIGELSQLRTLSKFTVREEGTIGELERLNHLCGTLDIWGLNLVKDGEEAKRAHLAEKVNLRSLSLCGPEEQKVKEDVILGTESVWDSLQPNRNIETLRIMGYTGLKFPLWMLRCDSVLPNIMELELWGCRCKQLPLALSKLQYLHTLILHKLFLVKDLGAQFFGVSNSVENGASSSSSSSEIVLFPKLRYLKIFALEEWEEEMENSIPSTSIMTCLQKLQIEDCPKLKVVPQYMTSSFSGNLDVIICQCPQVESLMLEGCITISRHSEVNLKYLYIHRSQMDSIDPSFFKFQSVQHLRIKDCEFLEFNPKEDLRQFPMLREVDIYNCPKVEECCSRDDWESRLSDLPYKITINDKVITEGQALTDYDDADDDENEEDDENKDEDENENKDENEDEDENENENDDANTEADEDDEGKTKSRKKLSGGSKKTGRAQIEAHQDLSECKQQ